MTHQDIQILIALVEEKLNDEKAGLTPAEKDRLSFINAELNKESIKIISGGLTLESVTQIANLLSLIMKLLFGDSG